MKRSDPKKPGGRAFWPCLNFWLAFILVAWAGTATVRAQATPQNVPAPQTQRIRQQKSPAPTLPDSLPKGKKLILKDGTFQLARSYEIQGDRVRFYSVERSEWEEIPASMVDWDATHKAEAEEARREEETLKKVRAEEAMEKAEAIDVDASIEVAPGVFLPLGEGLYVLDGRAVLQLEQSEAQTKLNKGRLLAQVLVPVPVVPGRRTVYISGKSAHFRIDNSEPEFYIRTADAREPDIELIRAKVHGGSRQIEYIDNFFGEQSFQAKAIPLERFQVAKGVYRLRPGLDLDPGEYALAETIPKQGMNLYVWDFGVDPSKITNKSKKK